MVLDAQSLPGRVHLARPSSILARTWLGGWLARRDCDETRRGRRDRDGAESVFRLRTRGRRKRHSAPTEGERPGAGGQGAVVGTGGRVPRLHLHSLDAGPQVRLVPHELSVPDGPAVFA